MKRLGFLGLFLLTLCGHLPAQAPTRNLNRARQQLESIRAEINQLQKELSSIQDKLQSELAVTRNLDKQITLIHRALRIFRRRIASGEAKIKTLNQQIDSLQAEIDTLRPIFAKQIVFAYKYMHNRSLEWLLGASNFHQFTVRIQYFRLISASARRVFDRIVARKKEESDLKDELSNELLIQRQLLSEKKQEETSVRFKRQKRKQIIQKIIRNKSLLNQSLKEKKKSYRKLQSLIASLEKHRKTRKLPPVTQQRWERLSGNFARQRGKLNWPSRGKIIHPYGRYRNPKLKTVLINNGIDIRAKKGEPVRCVFPGVVSLVTYLSGYGNMIIIDHNNGYYTVYAHLGEVLVSKSDFVEAGTKIGSVGETGSLEGPLLHFEIYGKDTPLNPIKWLKR